MPQLNYLIYALCNPRDGSIRYVGITRQPLGKRLKSHLKAARDGGTLYSSRGIAQLKRDGLRPSTVILEATSDPDREAFWIEQYRAHGCRLTNLTSGGVSGYSHSPETRQKITEAGQKHFKDLGGQIVGRLTILENASHCPLKWRCQCSCGQIKVVSAQSFSGHRVESCGCLCRELSAKRTRSRARHGMWQSKEYLTWIEMRARCNNPNHARYSCNGALGIRVCAEWQKAFEPFLRDMGSKPGDCVLMRLNKKQDYGPENCVWATRSELRKPQ